MSGPWRRLNEIGARGVYDRAKKHREHGRLDLALSEFTEAERYFKSAYGSDHPSTIRAGAQRAWCMIRLGNKDEGIRTLENCLIRETEARGNQTDLAKDLGRFLWAEQH